MADLSKYTDKNGFYSSLKQMKALFDKGQKSRFKGKTKEELLIWQKEKRELMKTLLGFNTFEPCGNEIVVLETVACDGYKRTKYLLQTEEFVYLPFYALVPDGIQAGEKRPVVICPHGHFSSMKESTAGMKGIGDSNEDIKTYNANYGEVFALKGYITFCPDARGFGERAEEAAQGEGIWKCSCAPLNKIAIPLGRCAAGMSVWDLVKLCDYIHTRSDCDVKRIGCAGLSGGGLQTLYFTAVDERIKCAASSGYFYGAKDSLLELNGNCDCNYIPHMWEEFDMYDVAYLIAPRGLIIESGLRDGLNGNRGIVNVTEQVDFTRKAYKILNAEEKIAYSTFDMGHMWKGDDIYPFFDKNL